MRELLFKNITSGDKKRRDLYVTEIVNRNGVTTTTQRHSTYIIGSCNKFQNMDELSEWKKNAGIKSEKRHIFVIKKRDTMHKRDMFICDVVGRFYAVTGCDIYSIAFKHSFEVNFAYTHTE